MTEKSEEAQVLDLLSCAETYHRADGEALDYEIVAAGLPNRAAKLIRSLSSAPSEQPEPVAWIIRHEDIGTYLDFHALTEDERNDGYSAEALYTQPSKQTGGGGVDTVEAIQRLILAADSYGVRYLDSDDMTEEAEELQAATEAMKDVLAAISTNEVG